jgi:hypothetical protein
VRKKDLAMLSYDGHSDGKECHYGKAEKQEVALS